ncbi:E3 ubiquitin-protein ligase SGR9, amyloplastic [Abrus precatorius]|uniref:RING-type E3 ubiquitin transferase n=1 Tax=Abrus precatorius TaxID=3816 RepID=A0A8B8MEC6_ABRPR|nr:E3 ubiquitin-protein ligase SGR9, amyloplastic [Abrus precatorius]
MEETTTTIMAALSTLTPSKFSDLTHSILSATHHHNHRLSTLLSSPTLFSLTLHHLHSLSLPQKTLLIARHLLSCLHHLTRHIQPHSATSPPLPPPLSTAIRQRELDAVLLLLLLCETHNHTPEALDAPFCDWRGKLINLFTETLLTLSCSPSAPPLGACEGTILIPFVETVSRCWRLVGSLGCGGGEGKEVREVAASAATVVALPAMEVMVGGRECVICKEEMKIGRDVCELPCQHLFHWMCILPWLGKRNTCPCCRFRLPSDDVFGEIQRLWEVLVKMGTKG